MSETLLDFMESLVSGGSESRTRQVPPCNVTRTETAWQLEIMVPGFQDSDIEISWSGSRVQVRGRRETPIIEGRRVRVEWQLQDFEYGWDLPRFVDPSQATASLDRGILTVTIPYQSKAMGQIPLNVAE